MVQDFLALNWQNGLIWLFGVLGFIVFAYNIIKQIATIFGIKINFFENRDKDHQMILLLQKSIQELTKRFDIIDDACSRHCDAQEHIQQLVESLQKLQQENTDLKEGLTQVMGNAAENRIRFYYRQGYILDNEYDSFCDFLDYAINQMGCNHGLERKYEDCKKKLPMLSAEEAINFEKNKREARNQWD